MKQAHQLISDSNNEIIYYNHLFNACDYSDVLKYNWNVIWLASFSFFFNVSLHKLWIPTAKNFRRENIRKTKITGTIRFSRRPPRSCPLIKQQKFLQLVLIKLRARLCSEGENFFCRLHWHRQDLFFFIFEFTRHNSFLLIAFLAFVFAYFCFCWRFDSCSAGENQRNKLLWLMKT